MTDRDVRQHRGWTWADETVWLHDVGMEFVCECASEDVAAYICGLQNGTSALAELVAAAEHYMEVRGSTHGQPARNRLRAAISAIRKQRP